MDEQSHYVLLWPSEQGLSESVPWVTTRIETLVLPCWASMVDFGDTRLRIIGFVLPSPEILERCSR